MAFKSSTQPLCRYCGKAISKSTEHVYFRCEGLPEGGMRRTIDATVRSKSEAQRYVNQTVVAVKYHLSTYHEGRFKEFIDQVTTWDGESYIDQFFCNGDHAKRFGYVMARAGLETAAHKDAMEKRSTAR